MLYLVLLSVGFFVVDTVGTPVPGAWVGNGEVWYGLTDHTGYYRFAGETPDSILVHATGYTDWAGLFPGDDGTITLSESVFPSAQTVFVTAARGSLRGVIPSTSVLSSKQILELSTTGMTALNGRVPGITVREYGGSLPVVSVSVRGGDASQVDYMIDGVSVVSERDGMPTGVFDPAVFSVVEIARGGAAPGGSGSGSAGSINFLPPLLSQPLFLRVATLSNGGVYFLGKHAGGALSLRRSVGAEGTTGYSTTFLSTARFAGLSSGFIAAMASGDVEGPDWSSPGDGHRKQGQLKWWATLPADSYSFDLNVGAGLMKYRQTVPFSVDDSHRDFSTGLALHWDGPIQVGAGLDGAWLTSTATGYHSTQSAKIHLSEKLSMFRGNLDCLLDADGDAHLSGRVSALRELGFAALHASFFSDYRSPTINDLFWPYDGYAEGNPDLRDERSNGVETGVDLQRGDFSMTLCGFYTKSDDLIIWLPGETGLWSPSNIASSVSRGLEFSLGAENDHLRFSGTFTWNIATDETEDTPRTGMLLPYRPEYTWGGIMEMPLVERTALELSLNGVSKRFTNRTQTEYLEEYWLADVSVERRFSHGVAVSLGVANIFDTVYEETNGYPGRQRILRVVFEYTGE